MLRQIFLREDTQKYACFFVEVVVGERGTESHCYGTVTASCIPCSACLDWQPELQLRGRTMSPATAKLELGCFGLNTRITRQPRLKVQVVFIADL
jgi:hypothetical protein